MKDKDQIDWKIYLPFVQMLEMKRKRCLAKGFSFGKQDYASHKSDRLKLSASIPSDCFILHKCRYLVIGRLCKKVFPEIKSLRDYLGIIAFNSNIKNIPCRNYSSKQVVMSFCGFGITPSHIRALLHRKVRISKLFVSRLEVKCFPSKDFLASDELSYLNSLPKAHIPSNRKDFTTLAYSHYRDYILSAYDIDPADSCKSWGNNLEIIRRGRLDVSVFEATVTEMCGILSSLSGRHIKPVSGVKSRLGYSPCGLLIGSSAKRNNQAIKSIKSEVLSTVQSNGHILHSDFVSRFYHMPVLKSRQDAVSHYARKLQLVPFYLATPETYKSKAWR